MSFFNLKTVLFYEVLGRRPQKSSKVESRKAKSRKSKVVGVFESRKSKNKRLALIDLKALTSHCESKERKNYSLITTVFIYYHIWSKLSSVKIKKVSARRHKTLTPAIEKKELIQSYIDRVHILTYMD